MVFYLNLMQVWGRINDKTNGGCQSDFPELEYKQWLQYRKMERSNTVVKEDLMNSCQEFEAGINNGKAWLKDRAWAFQLKKL